MKSGTSRNISFSGFETREQEEVYMMLVEKALQYVSFKLISVYKNCLRNNFNPTSGTPLIEDISGVTFKDQYSHQAAYS